MAAPIVGEKIMGARNAWRSFQAAIRRSASSSTWASVARGVAASFSAASRRLSSILRRLKPIVALYCQTGTIAEPSCCGAVVLGHTADGDVCALLAAVNVTAARPCSSIYREIRSLLFREGQCRGKAGYVYKEPGLALACPRPFH